MTQSMSISEFLNKPEAELSSKEIHQYKTLSLTIKAVIIVSLGLLPLHLNEILELSNGALNGAVEAYVNQFSPSQILDVLKGVK